MKKISFLAVACMLATLMSCSSDNKTITATSKEFTSGTLARCIEVAEESAELSYVEKDGAIPSQIISLKVTLKSTQKAYSGDPRDIDFTKLLSVATINLEDENGTNIVDISIKNEDLLKLKKLLTSEPGTTEEIVFEGEFHNSKDAPGWFKSITKFTPALTGDITVGGGEVSVSAAPAESASSKSSGGIYFPDDDDDDDYGFDDDDDYASAMEKAANAYGKAMEKAADAYGQAMEDAFDF